MEHFYTLFFCSIISLSITSVLTGMSAQEFCPEEIEVMISILHERKQPFPEESHKQDVIHVIPALSEQEFTRITSFRPTTEQESNQTITDICSRYQKMRWFVTHTKKFNLEQRLQEQGLKPFPVKVMICAISKREKLAFPDNAITIQRQGNEELISKILHIQYIKQSLIIDYSIMLNMQAKERFSFIKTGSVSPILKHKKINEEKALQQDS